MEAALLVFAQLAAYMMSTLNQYMGTLHQVNTVNVSEACAQVMHRALERREECRDFCGSIKSSSHVQRRRVTALGVCSADAP